MTDIELARQARDVEVLIGQLNTLLRGKNFAVCVVAIGTVLGIQIGTKEQPDTVREGVEDVAKLIASTAYEVLKKRATE